MQLIGKSKIGKLSAKGIDYPQLRLPKLYFDAVGKTANIYETEHEGKQAFLVVTESSVPKKATVLKPSEEVLKPCADVAQTSLDVLAEITSDPTQQSEAEESPKAPQKALSPIHGLVSCALCNHHFCASPGSVAAYHGALSRLRLGFKSRLGRFLLAFF